MDREQERPRLVRAKVEAVEPDIRIWVSYRGKGGACRATNPHDIPLVQDLPVVAKTVIEGYEYEILSVDYIAITPPEHRVPRTPPYHLLHWHSTLKDVITEDLKRMTLLSKFTPWPGIVVDPDDGPVYKPSETTYTDAKDSD